MVADQFLKMKKARILKFPDFKLRKLFLFMLMRLLFNTEIPATFWCVSSGSMEAFRFENKGKKSPILAQIQLNPGEQPGTLVVWHS